MTQETQLEHIGKGAWLLRDAGAIVSFSSTPSVTDRPGNGGKDTRVTFGKDQVATIRSWGNNNLLPQEREALVLDNNIVPELMATKRDITIGQGLMCYTERFESGKRIIEEVDMPKAARLFFDNMPDFNGGQTIEDFLLKICRNLMFHANMMAEYRRDANGKILSMEAFECRHIRPEKMNARGIVENWYWSGNWKERTKKDFMPQRIPAYMGEGKKQGKFVYHVQDDLLNDDYLGIPTWWGGRAWIECANAIPMFHINNLRNGYTIRWHIEIPTNYFLDMTAAAQTQAQKDEARDKESKARQEFLRRLNEFLAGFEQAGRALITEYEINRQLGKEFPGIKVTPLDVDIKDKALLELFSHSNDANISAQGVHPTLAAIQTQGKLSSGSEIRNAFAMYVAIKTPVKRDLLKKFLRLTHRVNGWGEGIQWGFRDIEITKLDDNPTGKQPVTTE